MKVFLSSTALNQLHQIINYLEENWSPKVSNNFIDKLDRSMELMSNMPHAFPMSQKLPGLRKAVITSQVTAYYRVDEIRKEVEIISVIDTRSNLGF